ncbi:MAG TPA: hypothetical protein VFT70_00775 [Nocardioides sp.]|nr:hypothetical protein [Nocardioides sp.]
MPHFSPDHLDRPDAAAPREPAAPGVLRRLLVLVLVTAGLGVGGYVVGRTLVGPGADGHAASSSPTPSSGASSAPRVPPTAPTESPTASRALQPHSKRPDTGATGTAERSRAPRPTSAAGEAPPTGSAAGPSAASPSGSAGSATVAPPPATASTAAGPSTAPTTAPTTEPSTSATPDSTPPQTSMSSEFPAPDSAVFMVGADEPATFACSLDGAGYEPCSAVIRYVDLAAGWHTLKVRATDLAGNTDPTPAVARWHSAGGEGS